MTPEKLESIGTVIVSLVVVGLIIFAFGAMGWLDETSGLARGQGLAGGFGWLPGVGA